MTFTERTNRDLAGPGFGTEFLLREGYDVLAVKNVEDDWYVQLGADEIRALEHALGGYRHRATYGSSMGAFAAIKFAKPLQVSRAIALSPVLDIRFEWDQRYWADIPAVQNAGCLHPGDMITTADLSPSTTYHFAVDPMCKQDAEHVRKLCRLVSRYSVFEVPLGGHPVGPSMRDWGVLRPFVLQAITINSTEGIVATRVRNGRYMNNLARYLFDRGKSRSALVANNRALALAPDFGEVHLLQVQILDRLRQRDPAVDHAFQAIKLEPLNPYYVDIIGRILIESGNSRLAEELLTSAFERMGDQPVLLELARLMGSEAASRGDAACETDVP